MGVFDQTGPGAFRVCGSGWHGVDCLSLSLCCWGLLTQPTKGATAATLQACVTPRTLGFCSLKHSLASCGCAFTRHLCADLQLNSGPDLQVLCGK